MFLSGIELKRLIAQNDKEKLQRNLGKNAKGRGRKEQVYVFHTYVVLADEGSSRATQQQQYCSVHRAWIHFLLSAKEMII